jgi:hypothetical protein
MVAQPTPSTAMSTDHDEADEADAPLLDDFPQRRRRAIR